MTVPGRIRGVPFLLVAAVLVACGDDPTVTEPGVPGPEVLFDAAAAPDTEEFDDFFHWLPPLAPQPEDRGEPSLTLLPLVTVRVCGPGDLDELCGSPTEDPERTVAQFTVEEGTGDATLEVIDEHYQVDWHTRDTEKEVDLAGKTVRLWVLVGAPGSEEEVAVGRMDLFFGSTGADVRSGPDDAFGLVDGRTLPIRFRPEVGLLTADCEEDCGEFVVTDEPFDECTEAGTACLQAPEGGWLPEGFEDEEVLVRIERVTPEAEGEECFDDLALRHGEGCYTFTTVPDLGGAEFREPLVVGVCQATDLPDNYELHQRKVDGTLVRLEPAPDPPGLDCDDFQTASRMGSPMVRLARLARPAVRFVFGHPLHARDNLSGSITSFSDVFYAGSVDLEPVSLPASHEPSGGIVPVEVRVVSDHGSSEGDPQEGVAVEFTTDAGTLSEEAVVSDADGLAGVEWNVPADLPEGEDPFMVTVTASVPVTIEPDGTQPTVTATVEVVQGVGTVQGVVTDGVDPLVGAQMTVAGTDLGTVTDSQGEFQIANVPAGVREIQVNMLGFATVTEEVTVLPDETTIADIQLAPQFGSVNAVAAGRDHTCVLDDEGKAFCWGGNSHGQLGDGTQDDSATPVAVAGDLSFVDIEAAEQVTCGKEADGTVHCWGFELGSWPQAVAVTSPQEVPGSNPFESFEASHSHACGIETGGGAVCWGANNQGQLGDGTQDPRFEPAPVSGPAMVQVSAGLLLSCGVDAAGAAYCWGSANAGALGDDGATQGSASEPVEVAGGLTFQQVAAGALYACGVESDGTAHCWGHNLGGELGADTLDTTVPAPVEVVSAPSLAEVIAGKGNRIFVHTCGLTPAGDAYCWGANDLGQVGAQTSETCTWEVDESVEEFDCTRSALPVDTGLSFEVLELGSFHTCGITDEGTLYCWGDNRSGQIGAPDAGESVSTPIQVLPPS